MPLTAKGNDIMAAMRKHYGDEKGERVFYAAKNAGTITGVDDHGEQPDPKLDPGALASGTTGGMAAEDGFSLPSLGASLVGGAAGGVAGVAKGMGEGLKEGLKETTKPSSPSVKDCEDDDKLLKEIEAKDNYTAGTLGTPAAVARSDAFGGLQQGVAVVPELMQRINSMTESLHKLASRVEVLGRTRQGQ